MFSPGFQKIRRLLAPSEILLYRTNGLLIQCQGRIHIIYQLRLRKSLHYSWRPKLALFSSRLCICSFHFLCCRFPTSLPWRWRDQSRRTFSFRPRKWIVAPIGRWRGGKWRGRALFLWNLGLLFYSAGYLASYVSVVILSIFINLVSLWVGVRISKGGFRTTISSIVRVSNHLMANLGSFLNWNWGLMMYCGCCGDNDSSETIGEILHFPWS